MASGTTRLHSIGIVRGESVKTRREDASEKTRETKKEEVAAFLASVRLGSLARQPRPGDVFRRPRYAPASSRRPLGLIPERDELSNPYARFLPPILPAAAALTSVLARSREEDVFGGNHGDGGVQEDDERRKNGGTYGPPTSEAYRHQSASATAKSSRHLPSAVSHAEEGEYADMLAECKYNVASEVGIVPQHSVTLPLVSRQRRTKAVPQTGTRLLHHPDFRTGYTEYFSFINQANLTKKPLYLDQRYAVECGECERCLGRMGRCSRCLALRVGGGYIILDGSELPENTIKRWQHGNRHKWSGANADDGLTGRTRTQEFGSGGLFGASRGANGDGMGGGLAGRGDIGEGRGWDGGEGRGGRMGGRWGEGGGGDDLDGLGNDSSNRSKGGVGDGEGEGDYGRRGYGEGENDNGDGLGRGREGSGLWDGDGMDSGRQSSMGQRPGSRMSGLRTGSQGGARPPSSMRRHMKGSDHRKKGVNLDRQRGGEGWGGEGEDGEDGGKRGRRRRGRGGREGEEGDEEEGGHRYNYGFHHDDDLEANKSGSLGDLMRFRSKRQDDVKALKATLKELQDIDPLDYLARYCIIDKQKLPHYQRVYENVDRDEDDEIDILELDFALKAVNFDLILDSELTYVHSVLELAGRHKLNFRFFCLIAALSEKVVALDDMVKRLINKMDFEALEVKLKKCKELFYLLADTEHNTVEQGGVVTVSSLAVELQAGGLTQEHVDYVCDHMNREDRGLVEFLDYLTYVPLFVEIHDTISDNPLDFTRTK